MIAFPTLSRKCSRDGYSCECAADPTIRSRSEGGYVKTRPRTTRVSDKFTDVREHLTASDISALKSFESSVNIGADAFNWTDPMTKASKTVRLAKPIKYSFMPDSQLYKAEVELEEV